ncbi:sex determination protein fruitless-like [Centruroides vittatus]|uniref:sex determination protein fruitless-like n=1 Tax=Centruroides vittatus TaxID=120091 RepID=UPI00350F86F7
MGSHQLCLKWKDHQTNMLTGFEELLTSEALVDVTLACEGQSLRVHKVILSAFSPFFQKLLLENPCKHPIVILNGIKYTELRTIVDFMYRGEVNVNQDQLTALLQTAESLKVKGLTVESGQTGGKDSISSLQESHPVDQNVNSTSISSTDEQKRNYPHLKRKRHSRVHHKVHIAASSTGSESEDQISNVELSSVELAYVTPDVTTDSNTVYPTIVSTHSQADFISHSLFNANMNESNEVNTQNNFVASTKSAVNDESSNCILETKSEDEKEMEAKCNQNFGNLENNSPLLSQLLVQTHPSVGEKSNVSYSEHNNCEKHYVANNVSCSENSPCNEQLTSVETNNAETNEIKPLTFRSPYNSGRKVAFEESSVHPRCPYCRKIYSRLSNLKRHMEIHMLDRKTYKCYICQKRFSWKTTLSSHLRRDHYVKVRTSWSHQE